MQDEKRLFIAVVFSILVILIYQNYASRFYKNPLRNQTANQSEIVDNQNTISAQQARKTDLPNKLGQEEKIITIENDLYRAVVTNNGAGIKEFYLMQDQFKDEKGLPLLVLSPEKDSPTALDVYNVTELSKRSQWHTVFYGHDIIIYAKEDSTKRLEKRLKFHNDNYIIELELKIQNKTNLQQFITYNIVGGSGIISSNRIDTGYISSEVQVADKIHRRKPGQKSVLGGEIFYGVPDWVLNKSRYFSFILKPEQPEHAAFIEAANKKELFSGIVLGPVTLKPGQEICHNFIFYAGPTVSSKIKAIGLTDDTVINYGMFDGLGKAIFGVLKLIYSVVSNYGISIILLSIFISIILLPLTIKSIISMKEMQKIQPEIEKIKKEFTNNPQKMNKEIMELYKKHKINPLGGCLPMLLQFPVFITLYQVLIRSVELKGAKFLWIRDLSEPDSAFRLPHHFPIIGGYINILPIIMIIAMVIQQKISQIKGAEVSEQQRMMSVMLPIVFGFIFYNMPSGLVLYWLTNTLIMIVMQEVVLKSHKLA